MKSCVARGLRVIGVLGTATLIANSAACSRDQSATPAVVAKQAPDLSALSPAQLKETATRCMREHDADCAELAMAAYVRNRPGDGRAVANLGLVLNAAEKDKEAIIQFEKAIAMGEGAYDLFGKYADSLAKVGRDEEAINWSYKALRLAPSLVDVRGGLARLLVRQNRPYEALGLLDEFDHSLELRGHRPYFEASRIAIESSLRDSRTSTTPVTQPLRLAKIGDGYSAPVSLGGKPSTAFIIDTGASSVVLDEDLLRRSKAAYTVIGAATRARLADGHTINGKTVLVDHLKLGPFDMPGVRAMVCTGCESLIGESLLSKFDMTTTEIEGVSVLSLNPRPHS